MLNSLIEAYREKLSFDNDISNIVASIIRKGNKISYNISSLPQWEQDFIDFLYELNYITMVVNFQKIERMLTLKC